MILSVLINNYNYGRYLDECIQSLQQQTYKNFEVILYDDGSSDNSIEIARKYSFVKIISNNNFGKFPSFNQANAINQSFALSKGDVICLLDSDDFFSNDKLEKIYQAFSKNENAVLVQNSAFLYNENKVVGIHDFSKKKTNYLKLYHRTNWTGYFNSTSNLSFKREYLQQILPLKEDKYWRVWPDVRLSRIAPFYGDVISLKDNLTYYRKHSQSDSNKMNENRWKSLQNQIDHHKYLNSQIKLLKKSPINFFLSFAFIWLFLKCFFPKTTVKIKADFNR